jgi:predicted metal-dependent enzyme (double-stranded beta helix superfamily)
MRGARALFLGTPVETAQLIIAGQGTVLFDASEPCTLRFTDVSGESGLTVEFSQKDVKAHLLPSCEPLIDADNKKGLSTQKGAYYWVSLDTQNLRILAGVGEARFGTGIYSFQFQPAQKKFLESLTTVKPRAAQIRSLLRDPITGSVPLSVKPTDALTMDDIAAGSYMPVANLSLTSQKLYNCISGKKFTLATPDFPDFVKAIEYSIATPGRWCYERLKQKANEFGKPNPEETYLRITLGENNGESPGVPYVMEIWPPGHFSPIHNHGGSSAVIRVLSGAINVSLFPFLGAADAFATSLFKKDDITWISPALNQVHQLKNIGTDTCITVQCYMYETSDTKHYDYFDYLDTDNVVQKFEPDSDMEFLAFKALMKTEWSQKVATEPGRWFRFPPILKMNDS